MKIFGLRFCFILLLLINCVIVFAQQNNNTTINWKQVFPKDSPPIRNSQAMAFNGKDRIFIYGGNFDNNYFSDLWQYNIKTKKWNPLPPSVFSPGKLSGHAMTYIGKDRLLIHGGMDGTHIFKDAYIYNIAKDEWNWVITKPNSSSPEKRYNHKMVFNGKNKALLFGGFSGDSLKNDTWYFSVDNETFSKLEDNNNPPARYGYDMVYTGNDKIIMFGGFNGYKYLNDTWLYNMNTNHWQKLAPDKTPEARMGHTMAYTGRNKVLLFGGLKDGEILEDTWEYNINTNKWRKLLSPNPPIPSYFSSMVYTGNNQLVLFASYSGSDRDISGIWQYDVSRNMWSPIIENHYPAGRTNHSFLAIDKNKILLLGGKSEYNDLNDIWELDISAYRWTKITALNKIPILDFHKAAYMGNNLVALVGFQSKNKTNQSSQETIVQNKLSYDILNSLFIFNTSTNNWSFHYPEYAPSFRRNYAIARANENKLLLFGGQQYTGDGSQYMNDTWLYELITNQWVKINPPQIPAKRIDHKMTAAYEGIVYLFGGKGINGEYLHDTWLFDVESQTWNQIKPQNNPGARGNHSLVYTDQNRIILFGGNNETQELTDTWIFNIQANTWSELITASTPQIRVNQGLTYAGNNKVLLFGGFYENRYFNDTWELLLD